MKNGQKGDSSFCVITISTLYFLTKKYIRYEIVMKWIEHLSIFDEIDQTYN